MERGSLSGKSGRSGRWQSLGGASAPVVLISALVIISAAILTAGYLYYQKYERNYMRQVEQQLSSVADLKVGQLVQWRNERLGGARLLYQNQNFTDRVRSFLKDPGDTDNAQRLRAWMSQIQEAYQYERVFLVDAQDVERMSVPEAPLEGAPHASEEIAEALRSGEITFLDFHRGNPSMPIHLSVLVPIIDEESGGKAIAALILRIDPETYLYPLIQRWPVPSETAETSLVRRDGNEVVFLNELKFQQDTALNLRSSVDNAGLPVVRVVLGEEGIVEGDDYRGVPVIADIRPVPDSPWFLVAQMDQAEAFAPLREHLRVLMVLIGALLLTAFAGVGFVWRQGTVSTYRTRIEAADALRESEERFRTTFEQAAVGIAHVSLDGRFLRVNQRLCGMLGYSPEDLMQLGYTDITDPQDVDLDVSFHEKLTAGQLSNYSLEKRYAGKGRNRVWVNLFVSLVSDTDGKPGYFVSVVEDITARKQAEEEIRRNARELGLRNRIAEVFLTERGEEIYARVLDIIREEFGSEFGVFGYIDEKGGLVVPTITRGVWDQCEVPDKRIVFPRDTWGCSSWPTAIREKRVVSSNEPSTVTPEGHITITRHISQPIIHLGEVIGLIQVANKDGDYTDEDLQLLQTISGAIAPVLYARMMQERHDARLREVMDDLARSNQELEQFAYVASHDLQEPLRMVASYTQLLERRYKGQLDENANEFIGYAVEGANRMQRLIQDLLAYSRVTSRGQEFAEANLEDVLAEAKANLQAAIEETGAEITSDPLPVVKADYSQMLQLLQNLIGNGVKFHGEEPPRVRISVEEKPAEWVFSVKDNGIGIDSQYFDRVFVIFQRLGGRADYAGTGIGLALSRRIVHRHGGSIWIESEPGKGSTFCFSLPKRR